MKNKFLNDEDTLQKVTYQIDGNGMLNLDIRYTTAIDDDVEEQRYTVYTTVYDEKKQELHLVIDEESRLPGKVTFYPVAEKPKDIKAFLLENTPRWGSENVNISYAYEVFTDALVHLAK